MPGLWQAGDLLLWVFRLVRSTFLRSAVKLNAVAEVGTLRFKMLLFSVCSYTRRS